ncbi:MAG: hypothetical protein WBO68_03950, partial [Pyrinomonadaceae bacterium]
MRLKGIEIRSKNGKELERLSIYMCHGLICGYAFETNPKFQPNIETIDVSNLRIEFLDTPTRQLKALIPRDLQELINWADVYDVELNGKIYYHLKDIGDGDFIGIDERRNIYEIRHDPFEIVPLAGDRALHFTRDE